MDAPAPQLSKVEASYLVHLAGSHAFSEASRLPGGASAAETAEAAAALGGHTVGPLRIFYSALTTMALEELIARYDAMGPEALSAVGSLHWLPCLARPAAAWAALRPDSWDRDAYEGLALALAAQLTPAQLEEVDAWYGAQRRLQLSLMPPGKQGEPG